MARKKKSLQLSDDSFSLTSMIDIIFLLLIYFMYLPIQQEADMTVALPVEVPPEVQTTLPSEQKFIIRPNCDIFLNGTLVSRKDKATGLYDISAMYTVLVKMKRMADDAKVQTIVTIIPDGDADHQSYMAILDACAKAGLKQVSFSDAI